LLSTQHFHGDGLLDSSSGQRILPESKDTCRQIVHDLVNNLSVIKSLAQLLDLSGSASDSTAEDIRSIQSMADHSSELCCQLQAHLKGGVAPSSLYKEVDLNTLIADSRAILESKLKPGTQLSLDLHGDLPLLIASESQLREVLFELVHNATRAIGKSGNFRSGRITVRTGLNEDTDAIPRTWHSLGDQLGVGHPFVEVVDSGCGMTDGVLNKMFEPNFTTAHDGHGLGMSSVLRIINEHGGSVAVTMRQGKGTTIRCMFPHIETLRDF
jgi:two-component system cell cycle sensor histidine kinase/response regulator CckA